MWPWMPAALPVSIGLWLALSPPHRRWLSRPEPYYGLAIGAVLFGPVLWWNATHHWISFVSTVAGGRPEWTHGGNFAVFLLLQFLYLAPLMFPSLLWALGIACRRGPWLFLAAAGVPLIAVMFAASLLGHVKGHWPAPGYIAAAIALAGIATEQSWSTRSRAWRAAAVVVLGSTALVTAALYALPALGPVLLGLIVVIVSFLAAALQRKAVYPDDETWATTVDVVVATSWVGRLRPLVTSFGIDVHHLRKTGLGRDDSLLDIRVLESVSILVHVALLMSSRSPRSTPGNCSGVTCA